jgi:hypothetical protein
MALQSAKYTAIHNKTGSDKEKLKDEFDAGHAQRLAGIPDKEPLISAIMYQLGLIQEELDYLRGIISSNNDKTGITTSQANAITANTAKSSMVLGTTDKTALAGNTTTISTAQANAITANTAKTSMTLGTTGSTALAGDTNIVTIGSSTTIAFGDMITKTTVVKGKTVTTYTIVMTVTNGGVSKSTTLTLT